jgi:hypothetical protein
MKAERIGKIVRVAPNAEPVAAAQALARNEFHITNIVGSQPKASVDALASMATLSPLRHSSNASEQQPAEPGPHPRGAQMDLVCREVEPPNSIQATTAELEDFDDNPKLRRFRAKQLDQVEYVVDVAFLENVIKVLIDNHSISITPQDIEAILSPFGECVVKTEHILVKSRGIDEDLNCCGCSKKQEQEAVEVVKSIALNGLSLVKHIPDLLGFLGKIGNNI